MAMKPGFSKQRIYASLMILGSGILLFRTISMMLFENAFEILVLWVVFLLVAEFIVDLACFAGSIGWLISDSSIKATLPLRLGAMAAVLHAIRVLIYVLGRTGPWINFDVKQEYHASYKFEWFWVYFAGILATLGVIGVMLLWQIIRQNRKRRRRKG